MTTGDEESRTEWLTINQPESELQEIYKEKDYYWYLRSNPFATAFLEKIGNWVNQLGTDCLDVACGEGQLAEYVQVGYWGFDGSPYAIHKARDKSGNNYRHFCVGRIEDPPWKGSLFDVIIFGGILEVLIKKEHRLSLLQSYQQLYGPEYMIIYDLERLDTRGIRNHYQVIDEIHTSADLEGIIEVKKHRQILVLKCPS